MRRKLPNQINMNRSEAGKKGYERSKNALDAARDRKSQAVREQYAANPSKCLTCGTVMSFEKRRNRFCNQSCAAQYNNRGVTRHIKSSRICQCGNPKKLRNKYCVECADSRFYIKVKSLDVARTDRSRKKIIIETNGYQCAICGIVDWMGKPIKLELDHVDGNADNNTLENLRLICPNCHSQTETYKGANAGKGSSRQSMRRRRYADGKTY